ncbi:M23 family metallopeptidase, partial [Streptomyces clavuligerus]|uniref:M23 family metallopeptidase n=1 Tax=Streptomyces clavuligerus TaxID=1901 RepID=UPI0018D0AB14
MFRTSRWRPPPTLPSLLISQALALALALVLPLLAVPAPGPAPGAGHTWARAAAAGPTARAAAAWPVGPPRPRVIRGWEPPPTPYGRGHRGVDLAAPPGTPVHAAADGRIAFAGPVGGRGVLAIALDGPGPAPDGLRITYEPVRALLPAGTRVRAGRTVARVAPGPSHCAGGCLHWGLRHGRDYLDPLSLLPPRGQGDRPSRERQRAAAG